MSTGASLSVYLKYLRSYFNVGVTSYCNLACPACPTGTKALGRPKEHLSLEVFRRKVDELRGNLLFMLFWDWGEPFLHPHLAKSVEADIFSVKTLRPYDYRGHDVDNELVPLSPALARYEYMDQSAPTGSKRMRETGQLNCGKCNYRNSHWTSSCKKRRVPKNSWDHYQETSHECDHNPVLSVCSIRGPCTYG